ncbi:hypothetical protein [Actinomarinicola tropica]|uniref:Uncharacterized protein n=1 Tax=Actinomarinicola tropica TaxID=2789776 RepID=A0A5Q2REV1_9ACTN|nr:hypothetical protein [Actinomarinicola tropica]QGG94154.1 hypothetical protein GH723_03015 [Actinomarinicola tropica]
MTRAWKTAIGVTVVVFVAVLALVMAANGDDDNPSQPASRITEMEQSGEMSQIWEQHRQMLERMQEDASPAMLAIMNNDPMWQMMRTPEWARMDEQHQEDIDRMLGE